MTNKELVLKFYDEVFNNWDISNLDNYMKDNYIQHNPTAPSGKEGFVEFTKVFFSLKPHMDIIHIGEDGDIVYVFFKCTLENGAINKNDFPLLMHIDEILTEKKSVKIPWKDFSYNDFNRT